ncbi:hypothetical protein [Actinacidiphila glaucinigra]|uniref:hypothetical protein n=1 Tax=Actinacidiphila glaucinigra TaxID=235986 RepID=UPI0029A27B01|nr:hypothetical protein [Streptomyces sp. PA03-3a]
MKGLEAASHELRRPLSEMVGPARDAGSAGASHPLAVNETVIALLRPKPDLPLLAGEPPEAQGEGVHGHGDLAVSPCGQAACAVSGPTRTTRPA